MCSFKSADISVNSVQAGSILSFLAQFHNGQLSNQGSKVALTLLVNIVFNYLWKESFKDKLEI